MGGVEKLGPSAHVERPRPKSKSSSLRRRRGKGGRHYQKWLLVPLSRVAKLPRRGMCAVGLLGVVFNGFEEARLGSKRAPLENGIRGARRYKESVGGVEALALLRSFGSCEDNEDFGASQDCMVFARGAVTRSGESSNESRRRRKTTCVRETGPRARPLSWTCDAFHQAF